MVTLTQPQPSATFLEMSILLPQGPITVRNDHGYNILQNILVKIDSTLKRQTGSLLGIIPVALRSGWSLECGFSWVFPICRVQALLPSPVFRGNLRRGSKL